VKGAVISKEVILLLLEIMGCTVMSGLLTYTYVDKNALTDAVKIQRITKNCKLVADEGGKIKTIYLLRKTRHAWGREFVYRIPLGLSFEDFQKKKQNIEDGLNHTRGILDLTLDDIRTIKWNKDVLAQIKHLLSGTKQRKEILMDYDGTLRIRVYREPLKEMIPFDDETLKKCTGWKVYIGESREGGVYHDFEKIPHMVSAGTTRYGKSVFLKNITTTFTHTQSKYVTFTLIDLKGGLAFNRFKDVSQVESVSKDTDETLIALRTIQESMKRKQAELLRKGYEDVKEAKQKERHFIIIDEAAEIASKGIADKADRLKKIECERIIAEIARIGGGLGYRLIFATQYPTADTLPRQVKQNCDARLCFRLQTDTASQVVLDENGAESLPYIPGRAIYRTDRKYVVQTPFIENDFIDKTIRPHITFKPRKEDSFASTTEKGATPRKHTLIIEEA
jgi:ribosomal protein S24E